MLCRLSYLRSSPAFLSSSLSDPKARFVLFNGLNPLCAPPAADGSIKLHTVSWEDVKEYVGDAAEVFKHVDGKNEKALGEVSAFWLADKHTPVPVNGVAPGLTTEEKRHHFINQVRSAYSTIAGMR